MGPSRHTTGLTFDTVRGEFWIDNKEYKFKKNGKNVTYEAKALPSIGLALGACLCNRQFPFDVFAAA